MAEAGYYGNPQAGVAARTGTAGVQGVQSGTPAGGAVTPPATPTAAMPTSSVGATTTSASPGTAGSGGAGAAAVGGSSGANASAGGMMAAAMSGSVAAGSGGAGMSGSVAGAGAGAPAVPTSPCDLSGRWLSTLHYVTDALGQLQYAHAYVYYEIAQQGDAFMITKGLHCGDDAIGGGALAATVDFKKSWAGCIGRVNYQGRTGSSVQTASGCKIDLAKWYIVRGATLPYYLDPAKPLPTAEEKGTDTTPGWEDWDGDGNPGISGYITGAVTGKIFVAPRSWTALSGTVAAPGNVFKLALQWEQQQNVMSYDGSPLLGTEAARAANATLHFSQFARLSADQAVGDDAAICKSVVELAPTLTPEAAGM